MTYAIIGSIEQLPVGCIAKIFQLLADRFPIVKENSIEYAPNIFYHDRPGIRLAYDPDSSWEEIPFILSAELFTSF